METKQVYFRTLGCDKNTVDTQVMTAALSAKGFSLTETPEKADIIVVNTCCFIDDAKTESIDAIFELLPYRTEGCCRRFIIAGCMAQRYADALAEEIPEADAFIGVNQLEDIIDLAAWEFPEEGKTPMLVCEAPSCYEESAYGRDTEPGSVTAYLKIGEGCSRHCTYCAIPAIRGAFRSRSPEAVIAEAKSLKARGVEECILIAQDLTMYGKDLEGNITLASLLDQLASEVPFTWIRLLYLYPEGIDDDLLKVMAAHNNICHYLDLPIQHTEDRILKRMGRHIDKKTICDKVAQIRTLLPDAVLRTTVIAGFPGETEEEFQQLLDTLKTLRFDRLGAFAYSQEEGTPAASFPHQIPEDLRQKRRDQIYLQQQRISREINAAKIGSVITVLAEGREEDYFVGRTEGDAPEIDCGVFIENAEALVPGQFYKVKINQALEYDLIGGVL